MPQFGSYPVVTSAAPTDAFLINTASGVKQIEFSDLQGSLSLSVISGVLPITKGGTGSNLTSPGQDSILFWDNSAAAMKFLSVGTGLQIVGTVLNCTVTGGGSGGGAPTGASYITSLPNADLTNEFALSTLPTGILKSTTTTGVLSIAVPGSDYATGPGSSTDNALVRFNGTSGGLFQDSNVILADSGTTLSFSGASGLSSGGSNQNVTLTPSGTGLVILSSSLKTAAPTAGPVSAIRFGQITTGAVTLDTTRYLLMQVDGATIKVLVAP